MSDRDWRWKIGEVIERLRSRYQHIGRKTGAPFLAFIYPVEAQIGVFAEWQAQISALQHEFDVRTIDVLDITQRVISDIGSENIVDSMSDPMPGSDPVSDLGQLWVNAVVEAVHAAFRNSTAKKPVVCLGHLAALYPAIGPRDIMQALWDSNQATMKGPVIVLIPGSLEGPRTYAFLDIKKEFMYRGDLL
jgi:hypothetical protein